MEIPVIAIVSSWELRRSAHSLALRVGTPQSDLATSWPGGARLFLSAMGQVRHGAVCTVKSPISYLCVQCVYYRNILAASVQLGLALVTVLT